MNIRQFSNAYLFSSEARPNIVHLALIPTFSLPAQAPQPPVDLYSRAMAAKNGELPAAPPEFAAVNAAMRSYVSCAVDCSAPLAEFTTRLCALAGNRDALATLIYASARLRQTAKAIIAAVFLVFSDPSCACW
jgi:hypothetical protein